MSTEIQTSENIIKADLQNPAIRHFLRTGDLAGLEPAHQDQILVKMCAHYGLDPVLRPFIMVALNGKTVWYPTKAATDQLANKLSLNRELGDVKVDLTLGIASQTCTITDKNGRRESASAHTAITEFVRDQKTGQVVTKQLAGELLANALMRLETKAKRRATLSWFGLVEPNNADGDSGIAVAEQMAAVSEIAKAAQLPQSEQAPEISTTDPQPALLTVEGQKKRGRPSRAEVEARAMASAEPAPAIETPAEISHKAQLEALHNPAPAQTLAPMDMPAPAPTPAPAPAMAAPSVAPGTIAYWKTQKGLFPENYRDFDPETSGRIAGEPQAEFLARFKGNENVKPPATVAEHVAAGQAVAAQVMADFGANGTRAKYNRTLTEHKLELHKALVSAGIQMTVAADIRIASDISQKIDGKLDLFEGAEVLPTFAKTILEMVNAAKTPNLNF
jgi:hypothetical protein